MTKNNTYRDGIVTGTTVAYEYCFNNNDVILVVIPNENVKKSDAGGKNERKKTK